MLQADFVITSMSLAMRWALALHDNEVILGFDRNRAGGSYKNMMIHAHHDADPCQDPNVDSTNWLNFMEDADLITELKLGRYFAFLRSLLEMSHSFQGLQFCNSHLLDTYSLFRLPFECRTMIEDNDASKSKFDEHRNLEGGRSKRIERYFGPSQRVFRLPVLSNDQDLFNMFDGILPVFCNRSDLVDPYVKFK